MFNPLNDSQVQQWFRRFAFASRFLPVEERTRQHQEMQQHLEALAAAYEERGSPPAEACRLALTQFGNPIWLGWKMFREWQQSRTGFKADMGALTTGSALVSGLLTIIVLWHAFWLSELYARLYSHGTHLPDYCFYQLPSVQILVVGWLLLTAIVIGRSYPLQALKTAFHSSFSAAYCWGFSSVWGILSYFPHTLSGLIVPLFLLIQLMPVCVLGFCAVAYLASVTKRGWYKPSLADFKMAPFPDNPADAGIFALHPHYRSLR